MSMNGRIVTSGPLCALLASAVLLTGCGFGPLKLGGGQEQKAPVAEKRESTIWDLFSNNEDPNKTVAVNKYLWQASLDVLNFLPVESIDPFTGVIITGYGRPPGGGRSYRAAIRITDPALDARSLNLSLMGAGGAAVSPDTVRAVEDAILTRARQMRAADGKL